MSNLWAIGWEPSRTAWPPTQSAKSYLKSMLLICSKIIWMMLWLITWVSTTLGSSSSMCTNTSLLKLTTTGGDCKIVPIVKIYLQ